MLTLRENQIIEAAAAHHRAVADNAAKIVEIIGRDGTSMLSDIVHDDEVREAVFGAYWSGMHEDALAEMPFEISKSLHYAVAQRWLRTSLGMSGEPCFTIGDPLRLPAGGAS